MNRFVQSLQKNKIGILFILIASVSTASGQMLWKLSDGNWNVYLLFGFSLYFIGAVLMIVAFRFGSLSVLHPLLSMGYVFGLLLGVAFLHEPITTMKVIGTLLITSGAILIGGGDH
ncbi:eamA-like transporter family protein [Anoxybacillus sp. B7M1]|jgi:drug/metabolite transporter (DMT)-like permease|uniref:EamA family transporter n=1 Tax=Anoxybacteroides rupiense TaxID=311460 RepID=A0ABD5IS83_9BACL|nr:MULTISPECIES: EamA family transporter [Anoxybacillus]ANB58280.1 eamA-like transporter family protein [Anoxybacillus sp. B2M1]ANB65653.1 eamA-like transporter family protein [Anoxybacillus sp. B7M1]MBB3907745.1 drug/metabolite transporter (DMT)-like permease [Anoxybacillus rupiensis]MBS2772148.1 EamA family transporter [Anoxybacillus rupiensis]MDE8563463.1 EamA family transporter [Anoxybacillus rupiensis]